METNPLKITELVLRDAHQSLLATRMKTEDMLPIAEKLDQVGFLSIEMWGGATFDTCIRFLNEDPWERARALKKKMPKTPFQMLLRGQNAVGYRHYADDVVEKFVKQSVCVAAACQGSPNVQKAMRRDLFRLRAITPEASGFYLYITIPFTLRYLLVHEHT